MANFSKTISITGWQNVGALLRTNGYDRSVVRRFTVINNSATLAYLHFTNSGTTQPTTATDGIPIANAAAPSSLFTEEGCDLKSTWINTAAAANITFSVREMV